jgi:hypothetical protein
VPPAKAATPKPSLEQIALASNVDELGALERELAPFKSKIARVDVLRKAIRTHYADSDAAKDFTATGEKFYVQVGPKSREAVRNIAALVKAIGTKVFFKIAQVTEKSLEAHLTAPQIADVTTYELTGHRTLKVFEKAA